MALHTENNYFELIMHLIADADPDENYLELIFPEHIQKQLFFAASGGGVGHIADQRCFGQDFDFIRGQVEEWRKEG